MRPILLPVVFLAASATLRPPPSGAQTRTPVVQSVDITIPAAPMPVRIAGRRHLAYELHLTNFTASHVVLTGVEVLDATRGTSLARYRDAELAAALGRPGTNPEPADRRVVSGGMRAVVFLWLPLHDTIPTPTRLRHRIELDAARPPGRASLTIDAGEIDVRAEQPVVLGPPLRGGPWAALYDPGMARGHRTSIYTVQGRARIPARFAIDWIRLDTAASPARGDASRVENWHGYAQEVLAVADGIVADARDDITDAETIGASQGRIRLENASGNYVALDLGSGRYAFYEHLKHGSVRVKRGDRVTRGQMIARLGNTGSSSSGPHLHFHVSDGSSPLAAEGLPYVFESFEVMGAFATIGQAGTGEMWQPAPRGAGGVRRTELPAPNVVVMFP